MSDNTDMTQETPETPAADDRPALEALADADPADAPDIAEGIAAGLQRELDHTGAPGAEAAAHDTSTEQEL